MQLRAKVGMNFVRLEFDPSDRYKVKDLIRETDLAGMQVFGRTVWLEFDPTDITNILTSLQEVGLINEKDAVVKEEIKF